MALLPGMIAFYVSGSHRNSWELSKSHLRKWNWGGRVSRCQDLGWPLERLPLSQLDTKLKVAGDSILIFIFVPEHFFFWLHITVSIILSFLLLPVGFSTMFYSHWINNDLEKSSWLLIQPSNLIPTPMLPHKLPSLTLSLASHRQAIFYLWHNPRDLYLNFIRSSWSRRCLPKFWGTVISNLEFYSKSNF